MSKIYKLIVWHLIVAVLAWKMWSYSHSVSFNSVTGLNFNWPAGLTFVILASFIGLGYIVFQSRRWAASISAIIGLPFLFYLGFTWLNLLAVGGFMIFNLYSADNIKKETAGRIRLNSRPALSAGLYPVVIGFFLMFSFAAYQSQLLKDIKKSQRLPSQTETFIRQFSDQIVGPRVEGNPKQKQLVVNEVASQAYKNLNDFFRPYFKYAPPILAFTLFLILWGLSWIFVWPAALLGLLFFWILKKIKFIKIEEKDVKAEILVV